MYESLRAGKRVTGTVGIFADGVAVRRVGEETFAREAIRRRNFAGDHGSDLRRDSGHFRRHALYRRAGRRLGGRGHQEVRRARGCTERALVAINGGANMNFDRLRYVAERADLGASAKRCSQSRFRRRRVRSALLRIAGQTA